MSYYFQGMWRMDWGLGNPNRTAALIAMMMIALWTLCFFKKSGFWIALTLFTGLGFCLLHTYSRGGILALFIGLFFLVCKTPLPSIKKRIVACFVSMILLIISAFWLKADQRVITGIAQEDRSVTNRFLLWKYAPRMILDAPHGWGWGNSGKIFTQWYQPSARTETYRTLVNSHLTWMAELGWLFSVSYLLFWSLVLMVTYPTTGLESLRIAFAIWLVFFISAFFSPVAEEPLLWVLPVVFLIASILIRWKKSLWLPGWTLLSIPISVVGITILLLCTLAQRNPALVFTANKDKITLGGNNPKNWFIVSEIPPEVSFPKKLRMAFEQSPVAFGVTTQNQIPFIPASSSLIFVENSHIDLQQSLSLANHLKTIFIFNPQTDPTTLLSYLPPNCDLYVFFGEFSQNSLLGAWRSQQNFTLVSGTGDYLPNGFDYFLSFLKSKQMTDKK